MDTIQQSNILLGYRCISCGREFSTSPFRYSCDVCGDNLDAAYDYGYIRRHWSKEELTGNNDRSLWRYLPLLPVKDAPRNRSIQAGGTPLVDFPEIADEYELGGFYIKDDTRNPSGSLKDRATEAGIQHASELGYDVLLTASTGNAAASLSALCAFYGKRAVILTPGSAPAAKLTQILQYGAVLCPVDGNYDDAFDLSLKAAEKMDWYLRSTGINPVMSEGKKTAALEIAEQMNWNVPDKVFVPVGDGCIIGGVHKGFYDLLQIGWIDRMPQLIAVQAEGSQAIIDVLHSGEEMRRVESDTIADSISVDYPRDGTKAVKAVKESGGFGIAVSDDEILNAQKKLSEDAGIFSEPAAAAAYAGFLKAIGEDKIRRGETVVVLITGTGLKDIPAAQKKITIPAPVEPNIEGFDRFCAEFGIEKKVKR